MPKILQISNYMNSNAGGIEQVARDIANAIATADVYEQKIICFNETACDNGYVCNRKNPVKDLVDGIEVIRCGCFAKIFSQSLGKFNNLLWEIISFPLYISKINGLALNLFNITPLFIRSGITVVHDIIYKLYPQYYKTFRNRISKSWHILQYSYICSHEKKIITVSEFSKKEIERHYPKSKGKIIVIPDAWQHVLRLSENKDWHLKYPFLEDKNFFFSLATLSDNKNGRWIIEVAKKNPNYTFAIAGKFYEKTYKTLSSNVHLLGYVTDEDACSLIKHCRAFIFPLLYEGFGLPPLEALALGAKVISSNITSLPEVLGESVHYINPNDTDINLESLIENSVNNSKEILSRYSWKKSASDLYKIIKNISEI